MNNLNTYTYNHNNNNTLNNILLCYIFILMGEPNYLTVCLFD